MREWVGKGKKATTSSFSISTLRQPIRGFGLESSEVPQAVTGQQALNKPRSHDLSRISMRPQAKLTVNQPGDVYEQEADRVAQQVMQRMSKPANQQSVQREEAPQEEEEQTLQTKSLANSITPLLQREEAPQEEEEQTLQTKSLASSITPLLQREEAPQEEEEQTLQTKSLASSITPLLQREEAPQEEEETVQTKSLANSITSVVQREEAPQEEEDQQVQRSSMVQRQSGGGMAATSDVETSIKQARGGGQPLAQDVRQPMEQAFGTDFSGVKVHTDSRSDQLNKSVQARAFTTGQDIFFRQGEYSPGSHSGQELLAHELTHVVQQNGNAVQAKSLSFQAPKEKKVQIKTIRHTIQRVIDLGDSKKSKTKVFDEFVKSTYKSLKNEKILKNQTQQNVKIKLEEIDHEQTIYSPEQAIEKLKTELGLVSKEAKPKQDLAGQHKQQQIAEYIDLLGHLGGEEKGKNEVSGGHLLTEMQIKWDNALEQISSEGNRQNVWTLEWKLTGRTPKRSTMFPENWTTENLRNELLNSNVVSGRLQLPSGIVIHKAGDTFYPKTS